jgi:hypothetical protein
LFLTTLLSFPYASIIFIHIILLPRQFISNSKVARLTRQLGQNHPISNLTRSHLHVTGREPKSHHTMAEDAPSSASRGSPQSEDMSMMGTEEHSAVPAALRNSYMVCGLGMPHGPPQAYPLKLDWEQTQANILSRICKILQTIL